MTDLTNREYRLILPSSSNEIHPPTLCPSKKNYKKEKRKYTCCGKIVNGKTCTHEACKKLFK